MATWNLAFVCNIGGYNHICQYRKQIVRLQVVTNSGNQILENVHNEDTFYRAWNGKEIQRWRWGRGFEGRRIRGRRRIWRSRSAATPPSTQRPDSPSPSNVIGSGTEVGDQVFLTFLTRHNCTLRKLPCELPWGSCPCRIPWSAASSPTASPTPPTIQLDPF